MTDEMTDEINGRPEGSSTKEPEPSGFRWTVGLEPCRQERTRPDVHLVLRQVLTGSEEIPRVKGVSWKIRGSEDDRILV